LAAGSIGAVLTASAAALDLCPSGAVAPVGIAVFCVAAALHYWKTQQALISANNGTTARFAFKRIENGLAEMQGLVQLRAAGLPFPLAFGGPYALTADAAAVLAREVSIRLPRIVVELGSGVSTVLVGRLLQQRGSGRIYSIEHDVAWAAETRRLVSAAGLDSFVAVLDAPLIDHHIGEERFNWYALPDVVRQLDAVDLLIVDGPPQRTDPDGLPRYPALPLFADKLSQNAAVFVDDASRPAETETVQLWLERFPGWEARWIATVPGTCLLSRKTEAST
jgi:hypothetical protein